MGRTVILTREQRGELEIYSGTGTRPAKALLRARALLLLDAGAWGPGWTLCRVSEAVGFSTRALKGLKARYFAVGIPAAVGRKPRETPPGAWLLKGPPGARLVALAHAEPPAGRARWTLRLLRGELVRERAVPSVSLPTVAKWLRRAGVDWERRA